MFESYEVGTRCWVSSKTAAWSSATVKAKHLVEGAGACELDLDVEEENGAITELKGFKIYEDPSPSAPLRNPPALEATSDLVTLSYLNEPSVLHAIRQRYFQLNIYTFSGIVLIATNPFDRVGNLYTHDIVQMYSGRQRGELEPHLFSIAEDAFRCMQRDNKNQTIVVSGESGAGKTMSAKYIMRYFATVEDPRKRRLSGPHVDSAKGDDSYSNLAPSGENYEGLSKVEREILATNPIMEAFGNAKTTRNDNSSRFGKYLEIRFDNHLDISGARIRTYLLERSRIVFHLESERNYHIFYQILRGLSQDQLDKLGLSGGISNFHYVGQGDPDIKGVDDATEFKETCQALSIVGVDVQSQWRVFELLAALLHLGNIELKATSRSVLVSSEDPALVKAAELLGVSASLLSKWLMKKQIQMRNETIVSDLDPKAALVVRDSIAKYLYSALFDWLVAAVNSKLYGGNGDDRFIGVLDIYGFEHFKKNSFEQFCINYANEKLQQEFNQHVFKLEQEEYAAEEIDWQYIDFVDNQPCITLIESKMGILGLLDEESRLPAGTDDGLTQKLYSTLNGKAGFRKPRLGQSSFIVAHYAHDVEYDTEGFLEKNRDTVPETIIQVLNDTSNPFVSEVLQSQAKEPEAVLDPAPSGPLRRGGTVSKRPTLGNIFKGSLIELMNTISSTNAHYIRCIKPNDAKEAWQFDGPLVLSQLRACGVLETIRISSIGFPGRWFYSEFAGRFELLLHYSQRQDKVSDARKLTLAILESFSDSNEIAQKTDSAKSSYALGKEKVFLRAGMLAKLENKRTKRQNDAAVSIQKMVKMRFARAQLQSSLNIIRQLQTAARSKLAREAARKAFVERCTISVQAIARTHLHKQRFKDVTTSVIGIQRAIRTKQAQARAVENSRIDAAIAIQSLIRGRQAHAAHLRNLHALKIVQSMIRRKGAQRELQRLREDQHSVKHYEENQLLMENKVVELQNALSSKREEYKALVAKIQSTELARASLEEALAASRSTLESDSKAAEKKRQALLSEIERHQSDTSDLRSELETRTKQIEQLRDTLADQEELVQKLTVETAELRKRNAELEEQVHMIQTAQIGTASLVSYQNRQQYTADLANSQVYGSASSGQQVHSQPTNNSPSLNLDEMSEEQARISGIIENMLQQEGSGVREELITELIRNVELPNVKSKERLPDREVLFPANITNLLVSEMWRFGLIQESEGLISMVLAVIGETVAKCQGDQLYQAGPFWLTNVHEMYSFMTLAENNILHSDQLQNQMAPEELNQYAQLTQLAKEDMTTSMFNIYYIYMRGLKKMLDKMIIPAVVEDQNIPGFRLPPTPTSRFLPSLFTSSSSSQIKMDDLILLLTNVLGALEAYNLEEHYINQPLRELMAFIGAKSFNDVIMRRNFLNWRRGVQMNYNITRIVEWCKSHHLDDIISPLEPITQSTKLLQLKKNWSEDKSVDVIYDICWALNPTQIQRIISNYQPTDYEQPLEARVHQLVTSRVKESKGSSTELLNPVRQLDDSGPFEICAPRKLEKLEPYIPQRLRVPRLREITELTTTSSRLQDAQTEQEQRDPEHGEFRQAPQFAGIRSDDLDTSVEEASNKEI